MAQHQDVTLSVERADGFKDALRYSAVDGRTMFSVDRHGTVTLADDLTLEEAKTMLRELAANCVRMMSAA